MVTIILILVAIVFVTVVAYLLLEQKDTRIDFYEELHKEDMIEIDEILNEEKFKIIN